MVVAVWKEKLTYSQSIEETRCLLKLTSEKNWVFDVCLAPNPVAIVGVSELVHGSEIKICSQNILWHSESGSYIGETTTDMLKEIGVKYTIVGHSERRLHFHETNEMVAKRAIASIEKGIVPIVCIGDTAKDRSEGRSEKIVMDQIESFIDIVPSNIQPNQFIIAYEPVWAISTWRNEQSLPDGKEVQVIHSQLREMLRKIRGEEFSQSVSILYGGSVAPENARDYMMQIDVDGALVGGASKTAISFFNTLTEAQKGFDLKFQRK